MSVPRSIALAAAAAAAAALAGGALAAAPWPGLAPAVKDRAGGVRYSAARAGGSTTLTAVRADGSSRSARFAGAFGIPAVTSVGLAGGLSPDGRLLVLVQPPSYQGLRTRSTFLVVSTPTLSLARRIVLPGEFGFDALSPDGRTLYLIQHASEADLVSYAVRAYDVAAGRLLPGRIADRRDPGEKMRGYPIARATTPGGSWVYTLYTDPEGGAAFVHALDAAGRRAFCIDLPDGTLGSDAWNSRLQLAEGGAQLVVRDSGGAALARIDTRTLRVGS